LRTNRWQSLESVVKTLSASPGHCRRLDGQFITKTTILDMSQHRSLRAASTTGAKRNVLKRFERIEILKKRGAWKVGDRVTGLRKTKPEV